MVKEFGQRPGGDFEAPGPRSETIRISTAIAVLDNLQMKHLDANRYLNGTLEEEIFMKPPIMFRSECLPECGACRSREAAGRAGKGQHDTQAEESFVD